MFTLCLFILSFIDAGLKATFFAHIYQYFMYFYQNKKISSLGGDLYDNPIKIILNTLYSDHLSPLQFLPRILSDIPDEQVVLHVRVRVQDA